MVAALPTYEILSKGVERGEKRKGEKKTKQVNENESLDMYGGGHQLIPDLEGAEEMVKKTG